MHMVFLFSQKVSCHANDLENEVHCLLHCPVFPNTVPATIFPPKCDVNTLEYKGDSFLRSRGYFSKYCSCHSAIGAEFLVAYLVSKYCAAGARNFLQQKPVLPSTAPATVQFFTAETRPPKYCSCHSAIGAEFLVAYLLSKYCAAGARIFLQQKPVLPRPQCYWGIVFGNIFAVQVLRRRRQKISTAETRLQRHLPGKAAAHQCEHAAPNFRH